jgi:hypothetical protein
LDKFYLIQVLPPFIRHVTNDEPPGVLTRYIVGFVNQEKPTCQWGKTQPAYSSADRMDGFNWVPNPAIIGYGGTSWVIESPDGTLFTYYGT